MKSSNFKRVKSGEKTRLVGTQVPATLSNCGEALEGLRYRRVALKGAPAPEVMLLGMVKTLRLWGNPQPSPPACDIQALVMQFND